MTIINKTTHEVEWRPGAEENWMGKGWAVVPEELRATALDCGGSCELTLNETGERVTSIIPSSRPNPPVPAPTQGEINRADLEYMAVMTGVSLTERGRAVLKVASHGAAYEVAARYYPRLWPLWRLEALMEAGKLSQEEYDELTEAAT